MVPLVPAKRKKGGKPRRTKRFSIRPPHDARIEAVLTPEEKKEIVAAAVASGESSISRFLVNAALMRARGQLPQK